MQMTRAPVIVRANKQKTADQDKQNSFEWSKSSEEEEPVNLEEDFEYYVENKVEFEKEIKKAKTQA